MRALCAVHTVHTIATRQQSGNHRESTQWSRNSSKARPAGRPTAICLGTVKESSSQIWLAGLGAFAKAQEEGSKVFEALVKEGAGLQKKFRQFADAQVSDVTNEVSGKITEATSKAAAGAGSPGDRV